MVASFFRKILGSSAADEPAAVAAPAAATAAAPVAPAPEAPFDLMSLAEYPVQARTPRPTDAVVGESAGRMLVRTGARRVVDNLYPFPAVAQQVLAVLENPNSGAADIAAVVNRDPAMATAILRLASSSFYGASAAISTVRDAIVRLGFREVAAIAGAVAASGLFDRKVNAARAVFEAEFSTLWYHAITTAFAASAVANERRICDPNHAFLAGLLHDIGKTVILEGVAAETVSCSEQGYPDLDALEPGELDRVIEELHSAAGYAAVQRWHLPAYLCETVKYMHDPDVQSDHARLIHVVRLVSGINVIRTRPLHPEQTHAEVRASAKALGLPERAFGDIGNAVRVASNKASAIRNNKPA